MEGKSVKPNAVMLMMIAVLVLGMFVGPASAKFRFGLGCYAKCFIECAIEKPPPVCGVLCLTKCIKHPTYSTNDLHHHYCQIGCASSKCTNISTQRDPRAKEVGICVDSCSDSCIAFAKSLLIPDDHI